MRFGSNGHNDNSDAFRHAYWNALMVKHIDYRWATAHEEGDTSQPQIEKDMDLYNNIEGRLIGYYNINKSDGELADLCDEARTNGELRKIVNGQLVPTTP